MNTEFEIFPGKNLSELFKDIYENQRSKKSKITDLITEIKKTVRHAGDYAVLGPIIKDLIDSSIKNDDSLVKMATIVQRIISATAIISEKNGTGLSEAEKKHLIEEIKELEANEIKDDEIDTLTNEVKTAQTQLKSNE